jgi:hypothetical protein
MALQRRYRKKGNLYSPPKIDDKYGKALKMAASMDGISTKEKLEEVMNYYPLIKELLQRIERAEYEKNGGTN